MILFNDFLKNNILENRGLAGLSDELFGRFVKEASEYYNKPILIVTSSLFDANKINNCISDYSSNSLLFPMDDFLTSEAIAISPDLMINRLDTLNDIINGKNKIVVTNLMGYLRYLPSKDSYVNSFINLKVGKEYDSSKLIENLVSIGYNRESIVNNTGEFGVRGFVIDIFPLGEENPIRIEFFGDEIDSIRYFDPQNQKSIKNINSIIIRPYTEFIVNNYDGIDRKQKYLPQYSDVFSIKDYLENPIVIFKDYNQLKISYKNIYQEMTDYKLDKDKNFDGNYMHEFNLFDGVCHYLSIDNIVDDKNIEIHNFNSLSIPSFNENIDAIYKYLRKCLDEEKYVLIYLKDYEIKNFTKNINLNYVITDEENILLNTLNIIKGSINYGYTYDNYVFVSDRDLFNFKEEKSRKYKNSYKYATRIRDINKLNIGDYVVHDIHGIGVYDGIKTLSTGDIIKDYIVVSYLGNDKLYIPVEKIDLISKYSGNDGALVKINKLGGNDWKKTKSRVREKIKDIANKLIRLYADREMKKGFMFSKDNELQLDFENEFIYDATNDQLRAVQDIKNDMESSIPMDRLLCGDVGYGKTEVAFRAMFKAVMDSKQVLYLCPTTILSNQQYKNAIDRFKNYPVSIALLNRFTTPKEVKRIVEGIKEGTIDIVFGTHRLLSDDIKPKDLGLLVIDEEQRFGVMHKEKIKEYKSNVDVLTLTATPIPRTLQMSMVGIRSLSLIETPPVDRYPVQTYVIEESKEIIRDAIYKELSRNGQIFILYNRVETIEEEVRKIQALASDARIIFAHGKMTKTELEDKMMSFINHEADILVCTTIIETGIDIPNVNTLIIIDADRFGLSQLYQIRGRVGRSNKIAYAYLMYSPNKVLNDTAVKRLNVIKEFTELGSGFSIAARDLSIRGAGDILGSEQAGFIDSVGIDLYLKILNDEITRIKGGIVKEDEIRDEKPLISVTTHISDSYVSDTDLKIEIHKKINQIDSYEKLNEIKVELEDRFGKVNEDIIIYMYEEWFEKLAKEKGIEQVKQTKNSIELYFSEDASKNIDGEKLFESAFNISNMFRFKMLSNHLVVIFDTIKLDKHYLYYLIDLLNVICFK